MTTAAEMPDTALDQPAVPDTRYAAASTVALLEAFFAAKNSHVVEDTMAYFSPRVVTYTESTLGWPLDGYDTIEQTFRQHMPTWPETALSYPTRILGGTGSALVAFTDMPELFGGELRILGAIDFEDGRIIRWVDYWDSLDFDDELYAQLRTPADSFPVDFKEGEIGSNAAPGMVDVATRLQDALAAGDARAAAALCSYDVVLEDMAIRSQLQGRSAVERYLTGALEAAPYGTGSRLRHVVGGPTGGGFEWIAGPGRTVACGITALEVDASGRVSRLTTTYDGRHLTDDDLGTLTRLVLDRP